MDGGSRRRGEVVKIRYWVPRKLPQIYTVIAYICIGKVAGKKIREKEENEVENGRKRLEKNEIIKNSGWRK